MQSERVLAWLKPQYLGDAVMAAPLLDLLTETYGTVHVSAGCLVQSMLDDRRDRLEFVDGGSLRKPVDFLRRVRKVRSAKYDAVFLVNHSFRSALASRCAGVRTRVGHGSEGRGFLLTKSVEYPAERFEAECFLDLARAQGLDPGARFPSLAVTQQERDACGLAPSDRWIGVQPGARTAWKQLPLETLSQVAARLRDKGYRIAMLGGPEEAPDAERFAAQLGGAVENLVGACKLRETMGVLTHLKLMLGSDTGLMHVAAAVGCPTLTVFGIVSAAKWGHAYAPHRAIQAPSNDLALVRPDDLVCIAEEMLRGETR